MDSRFTIDLNQLPSFNDHELLNEEGEFSEDGGATSSNTSSEEIVSRQIIVTVDIPQQGQGQNVRKRKFLTNDQRWTVYCALLEKCVNGKLKRNSTKEVQDIFIIETLQIVQRIWNIHKRTPASIDVDISSRKKGSCGRKRVEVDLSRIKEIELHQRTTLTSLSNALEVNYSKCHRLLKQGMLHRHSNAIKPDLKEENKISRLRFCLSMLDNSTLDDPKFGRMYNYIHIDEKWFYMTRKEQTYYLLDNEDDSHRSCQSKNFITKVIFLGAIARPRFDDEGIVVFDGKIRCCPFVTEEPTQRNSINRLAGTMEMKTISSVKRETITTFLIEKVIPAIQEKWQRSECTKTILIQQGNARIHVHPTDLDFLAASSQDGFDICLTNQPPNSPDFNILDLAKIWWQQDLIFSDAIIGVGKWWIGGSEVGLNESCAKEFPAVKPVEERKSDTASASS